MSVRYRAAWIFCVFALAGCAPEDSQVPVAKTPMEMEGIDALVYATKGGDLETVKRFLSEDPTLLTAQDHEGNTLLHIAASYNRLEMVALLLEQGADPAAENFSGRTPLEVADSERADREVLDLLRS